jgi:hypothetical protein
MKEHPIIFSLEMVKAILEGRKTQTRRIIKGRFADRLTNLINTSGFEGEAFLNRIAQLDGNCPYGQIGDRLWIRESFSAWFVDCLHWYEISKDMRTRKNCEQLFYRATHWYPDDDQKWVSARFMPKWATRIWLEIINIRVERIQNISLDDIFAEGCPSHINMPLHWFQPLWDKLNAKRSYDWKLNPWVWVIKFKQLKE